MKSGNTLEYFILSDKKNTADIYEEVMFQEGTNDFVKVAEFYTKPNRLTGISYVSPIDIESIDINY